MSNRSSMKHFNSYCENLNMDFFRSLCEREGQVQLFRKGEPLALCGSSLKYWGFVLEGYFKYSVIDKDGTPFITGFSFQGSLAGDFLSIVRDVPVKTDITAATDSKLLMCSVAVLKRLLEDDSGLRNLMAEGLFNQAYTQYIDLYRQTPQERYCALLRRCPDILQKISLKEIASYLRITPTHLSRIRKKLTFT